MRWVSPIQDYVIGLRYDFYFISKLLLEKGAEREVWDWNCGLFQNHLSSYRIKSLQLQVFEKIPIKVENADGCKAILGISGSKEGAEADVQFCLCQFLSVSHTTMAKLDFWKAWDAPTNILKNASTKEEVFQKPTEAYTCLAPMRSRDTSAGAEPGF